MNCSKDSAESLAISASLAESTSVLTAQSAKMNKPCSPRSQSGTSMRKKPDTEEIPGFILRSWSAGRIVLPVEWQAPDTAPSASPHLHIRQA